MNKEEIMLKLEELKDNSSVFIKTLDGGWFEIWLRHDCYIMFESKHGKQAKFRAGMYNIELVATKILTT